MVNAHFVTDNTVVNVRSEQQTASVAVKSENVSGRVGVSSYPIALSHDKLSDRDISDQHPMSAITGLEEALLNADKTFVFEQGVASNIWNITHNLNKYPSVTVVDSAGNEVIAEVTYTDLNRCVVTMTAAFKGKAYLN